jgi:hypothetical protein
MKIRTKPGDILIFAVLISPKKGSKLKKIQSQLKRGPTKPILKSRKQNKQQKTEPSGKKNTSSAISKVFPRTLPTFQTEATMKTLIESVPKYI